MLREEDLLKIFSEKGALLKGHFRLSSGRHSDTYVQCALVLKDTARALELGKALKEKIEPQVGGKVDLVLSPALGALIIGYTVALAFGCEMIFAERMGDSLVLRRGFSIPPGARVLIVEDVVTTAGSALELERIVENAGARTLGVACIVDRSESDIEGIALASLIRIEAQSWGPDECPLCAQGIQLTAPGSRRAQT